MTPRPELVFYEKPGCINNRKQKDILRSAGFVLDVRNLLTTEWSKELLQSFFGDMPVQQWFNLSAPAIKSGEVQPQQVSQQQALQAMLCDPLLIRRPLIQCGGIRRAGFDLDELMGALGIDEQPLPEVPEGIETCPRTHKAQGGEVVA